MQILTATRMQGVTFKLYRQMCYCKYQNVVIMPQSTESNYQKWDYSIIPGLALKKALQ